MVRRHIRVLGTSLPIALLWTLPLLGVASASTLGAVQAASIFARTVSTAAVTPRMLMADAFTSGTFTTGRLPQQRPYLGRTWTVVAGNWSIVAGSAQPQPNGNRIAVYDAGSADVLVAATVTRQASSNVGLIVRSDATASTYLLARIRNTAGGTVSLEAITAGASTTLATASNIGSLSVVPLRVEVSGASVIIRYNNTAVVNYVLTASQQVTFGSLTTTGIWVSNGTAETFDDFYVATWPPN